MGHRAVGFLNALAKEHQTDLSGQRVEVIRELISTPFGSPVKASGPLAVLTTRSSKARACIARMEPVWRMVKGD